MTQDQIAYAIETAKWATFGILIGLILRPVLNRRNPYHRRSDRRD